VLDLDIEVAMLVEDSGVDKFVLEFMPGAGLIDGDQVVVREPPCGYLYSNR
jgi:hypothetical protein